MSVDRDLFLDKFWIRYPPAPTEHGQKSWVWGRLGEWNEHEISLQPPRALKLKWHRETRVSASRSVVSVDDFRAAVRVGDWLALRDRDGEASEILLLAPALSEPRQASPTREMTEAWRAFYRRVEDYFVAGGFLQVTTPTLVVCPGTEPHLEPFQTRLKVGSRIENRYLPTSPELSLKKILALGHSPIFEIKNCFRNGEVSPQHQPEFLMLEWYRAFANLDDIRRDVIELIRNIQGDPTLPFQRVTMAELFEQFLGFRLTPQTQRDELARLARSKNIPDCPGDSWDDLFFRLFIEVIEPALDTQIPLFVEKYPPSQAALARLTDDGWGDRFELYWRGFEIANAYHELNDPIVQRQRTERDLQQRQELQRTTVPIDHDFFRALESGLPPAGGIALGLERLFLASLQQKNLSQIRFFPEI